jgi:predicted AAA+ superfamily ATPase
MRLSPKRYLTDPSLVVSALGSSPAELLADHSSFGQIFEGLCLRDLAVYAGINDAELLYYRDYNDLEVDAILRRPNGSYAAFEIKLSASMEDVAASTLKKFAARMKSLDVQPPVCMGIITGDGAARQRDDGIIVIPIACLRD